MSNLVRRMQRMASRSARAKKAAIGRQFATQLGITNPKAADLLARQRRHSLRHMLVPRALRRTPRTKAWLEARAERRKAGA